MCTHTCDVLVCGQNAYLTAVLRLEQSCFTPSIHNGRNVCVLLFSYRFYSLRFGVLFELSRRRSSGTVVVWHVAALEFFTIALVQFLYFCGQDVVGSPWYDPQMGQSGCRLLLSLSAGVFVALTITALHLSCSIARSIPLSPMWCVFAQ